MFPEEFMFFFEDEASARSLSRDIGEAEASREILDRAAVSPKIWEKLNFVVYKNIMDRHYYNIDQQLELYGRWTSSCFYCLREIGYGYNLAVIITEEGKTFHCCDDCTKHNPADGSWTFGNDKLFDDQFIIKPSCDNDAYGSDDSY